MPKPYRLLDCGDHKKVEQFGDYKVIRPAPQALWKPANPEMWKDADSEFIRTSGEKGHWKALKNPEEVKRKKLGTGLPDSWDITNEQGLIWTVEPNDFGNIGVFTEHWIYVEELAKEFKPKCTVLNLFTYSGSNCVGLAKKGFKVVAVDSSKSAMNSYVKNLESNKIDRKGHKLVLEDAYKFLARETRRKNKYDAIMMDAPSYGRGTKGEIFAIEEDLLKMIESCKELLSKNGKFVMTSHSPRFTPELLRILLEQIFPQKKVTVREILNKCESGVDLPSGILVKIY